RRAGGRPAFRPGDDPGRGALAAASVPFGTTRSALGRAAAGAARTRNIAMVTTARTPRVIIYVRRRRCKDADAVRNDESPWSQRAWEEQSRGRDSNPRPSGYEASRRGLK